MKNILLIGVGGTGSSAVDILYEKINELGNQTGSHIAALVFDTDAGDVAKIRSATPIAMSDPNLVGTICDDLGVEALREWFPYDDRNVRAQEMVKGASQWRKKSFLAFCNLINKQDQRAAFHQAMDSLLSNNPGDSYEIYTIASIAGGTGSGSFIPITLYAKRYIKEVLGKSAEATALLACPDIYVESQTEDNKVKVYANAYAILRELNAINLVTHGYNHPKNNNVPVRFSIGNDALPYVRTLFNSEDEAYWAPEAAPFQKIFMLDKIPSLNSVIAHDIVLANSLYTILCTEIGNSFASEISNHAMLLSSSNGYNAIFAGIATAELTYPKESILDYVAHKKTEDACAGEWLKLYWDTEDKINEEKERAKEARRTYNLKDGEYAEKMIISAEAEKQTPTCSVFEILERGTEYTVTEGNITEVRRYLQDIYLPQLDTELQSRIPSINETKALITSEKVEKQGISRQDAIEWRAAFIEKADSCQKALTRYYKACVTDIRNSATSIADAILPMDIRKPNACANERLSFVYNVLTKKGKYIHPVAAMTQLCYFKKELASHILNNEWPEIQTGAVEKLSEGWMVSSPTTKVKDSDAKKSYYINLPQRFAKITEDADAYTASRSNATEDAKQLEADAMTSLNRIYQNAILQLKHRVFSIVSKRVDVLIDQYRAFFARFDKAREDLKESTKEALRMSSGIVGSVINIAADEEAKINAYKALAETSVASAEDIIENDHIAGSSVFKLTYEAAQYKIISDKNTDDSDMANPGSFSELFKNMIEAYKKQIRKSDEYRKMTEDRTILEIITDSCGMKAEPRDVQLAHTRIFTELTSLAIPSLKADNLVNADIPEASLITVFLFSAKMAKYLKKNADKLGLSQPDPSASEARQILSCAQQFLNKVGANGARVAIVNGISDHTIYVTRENIDIQPIQVRKFDEMSSTPIYFDNYKIAIDNIEKLNTDMWNPHLGFNLHKRGYLPYINPNLEKESGKKLAKALLYAIMADKFTYQKPLRQALAFRFKTKDGFAQLIRGSDGQTISTKNISGLLSWLRPQTKQIEEWADAYDYEVKIQCNALPAIITERDVAKLEAAITKSPYIEMLRENVFKKTAVQKEYQKQLDMNLIEFANAVKASEETIRDCDDAEMILLVGYETFCKFCQHRISPKKNPERYASVYTQQLDKFIEAFVMDTDTLKTGDPIGYAKQVIEWMTNNECFRAIPTDNMFDSNENIIWVRYTIEDSLAKKVAEKYNALPPEEKDESEATEETE
ncbi:MAG: hypothetical protein IJW87_05380 [Clostridia bacterium]|nr:hypothetical protein [Clostridia bacterium]